MKKFFLFCLIVLSNYTINAQESAVKVNPFAFLWGSDLVSYERMITDNSSGIIGVGVGGLIALLEFLKNKKTKELQQKNAELENKIKQLEILKLSKDLDGVV